MSWSGAGLPISQWTGTALRHNEVQYVNDAPGATRPWPPAPGIKTHRALCSYRLPEHTAVGTVIDLKFAKWGETFAWTGRVVAVSADRALALIRYEAYDRPLYYPPPRRAAVSVISAAFLPPAAAAAARTPSPAKREPAPVGPGTPDTPAEDSPHTPDTVIESPPPPLGDSPRTPDTVIESPRPTTPDTLIESPPPSPPAAAAVPPRCGDNPENGLASRHSLIEASPRTRHAFHNARNDKNNEIILATFNARSLRLPERLDALLSVLDDWCIDICAVQEVRDVAATDECRHGFNIIHTPSLDGTAGVALILSPACALHHHSIIIPTRALIAKVSVTRRSRTFPVSVVAAYFPCRLDPTAASFIDALCPSLGETHPCRPRFLLADANGHADAIRDRTALIPCNRLTGDSRSTWHANGLHSLIDHVFVPASLSVSHRVLLQPVPSDHRLVAVSCPAPRSVRVPRSVCAGRIQIHDIAYNGRSRRELDERFRAIDLPTSVPLSGFAAVLTRLAKDDRYNAAHPRCAPPWEPATRTTPRSARTRDQAITASYVRGYVADLRYNPWMAWKHIDCAARKPLRVHGLVTVAALADHFKSEFERPAVTSQVLSFCFSIPPVHIQCRPFALSDLTAAIATMKNHTAPGPDGIPIEAFRVPSMQPYLLHQLNTAFATRMLPSELSRAWLTPLFKKGDPSAPANYRPIVLMSVPLKVLHKMLLHRLRTALDKHLLPLQAAYRRGMSTGMHIASVAQLVETAKVNTAYPLHMVFCDFSKAFDSVHRPAMFAILAHYGVPPAVIAFLEESHRSQVLHTRFDGNVSPSVIRPSIGVMQGDTLAPWLFTVVMDYVLRHLPTEHGAVVDDYDGVTRIPALAYADDVVLLSNSAAGAQRLLHAFEAAAARVGLRLNTGPGKTEAMLVTKAQATPPAIVCSAGNVPITDSYKYLGWLCSTDRSSWKKDLARRRSLAWLVVRRFARIWTSPLVPTVLKRQLAHALVSPILTYAASSYPPSLAALGSLHVSINKVLRVAQRAPVMWGSPGRHIHTEQLYGDTPIPLAALSKSLLTQWGHWVRLAVKSSTYVHPVVIILTGILKHPSPPCAKTPASLLAFISDLDTEQLVSCPMSRSRWKMHVTNRIIMLIKWFLAVFIVPRRLGSSRCPLTTWNEKVATWIHHWNAKGSW